MNLCAEKGRSRGRDVLEGSEHGNVAAARAQAQDSRHAGAVEAHARIGRKAAEGVVRVQVLLQVAATAWVEASGLGQRALERLPQLQVVHDGVVGLVEQARAVTHLPVELLLERGGVEDVLSGFIQKGDHAGYVGAPSVERIVEQELNDVSLKRRHAPLDSRAGALPRAVEGPRSITIGSANRDALLAVQTEVRILAHHAPDWVAALVAQEERLQKALFVDHERLVAQRARLVRLLRELRVHVVDEVRHGQVAVACHKVDACHVNPQRIVLGIENGHGGRVGNVN